MFQHGVVSFPCLLRPCLSLDMTSDAVHRLMLPSQRTLQIMAAVDLPQDEGTNKIAPRAPCGLTIHCMVFNVFVHLCLWTGCDVHLPGGEPSCPDQCAIITRMVLQQPNGQHGAPSLVAWMIFVADIFWNFFLALSPLLPASWMAQSAQQMYNRVHPCGCGIHSLPADGFPSCTASPADSAC